MSATNLNRVVLTGNLTRDPELRSTQIGHLGLLAAVACNTRRKNSATGQWDDKPNYFDVTVWGTQGENCARFLAKGRPVAHRRPPGMARIRDPGRRTSAKPSRSSPTPSSSSRTRDNTDQPTSGFTPRSDAPVDRPPCSRGARAGDDAASDDVDEEDIPFERHRASGPPPRGGPRRR